MIYKLLKVWYSFKQLSSLGYKKLFALLLKKLGFKHIHANYSIFITKLVLNKLITNIFIDDIKIMRPKKTAISKKFKLYLLPHF